MDSNFWLKKWDDNQIGFHEDQANRLLVRHFDELEISDGGRIFLPLCGKTRDIAWLLSRGCRVAGVELSQLAIEQLFADLEMQPTVSQVGNLKRFSATNIDVFVGDFFELAADNLGPVDAIYDRAALVALPESMRVHYIEHLTGVTRRAPQLLICFEYDQTRMAGPPFSIRESDLTPCYSPYYELALIERIEVPGGLKGQCAAQESAWLLR